jgi:hypothetical protein
MATGPCQAGFAGTHYYIYLEGGESNNNPVLESLSLARGISASPRDGPPHEKHFPTSTAFRLHLNHNTTTMNGPLFNPPRGGGMDGADAQTMAAIRSVCSLHLFNSGELDFNFDFTQAGIRRRSLDDGNRGGVKSR